MAVEINYVKDFELISGCCCPLQYNDQHCFIPDLFLNMFQLRCGNQVDGFGSIISIAVSYNSQLLLLTIRGI